ncbi:hypothetical protein EDEG_03175 [Edhazardia aedis USNM 41457]|uniref:Dynactin subunit 6 n=1 Tax=Edhazardia aedis (strain USNM 41457) TaxID=1003232 RepID=J9D4C0_EDHAE|nr:hypothetical protein EDEG_03175 [Edhazardia aedis USNM 41457]|eukprot:EJW02399.1 hypothetical protein EDEG_03175 [Edhazardia aedis USNM 41457]
MQIKKLCFPTLFLLKSLVFGSNNTIMTQYIGTNDILDQYLMTIMLEIPRILQPIPLSIIILLPKFPFPIYRYPNQYHVVLETNITKEHGIFKMIPGNYMDMPKIRGSQYWGVDIICEQSGIYIFEKPDTFKIYHNHEIHTNVSLYYCESLDIKDFYESKYDLHNFYVFKLVESTDSKFNQYFIQLLVYDLNQLRFLVENYKEKIFLTAINSTYTNENPPIEDQILKIKATPRNIADLGFYFRGNLKYKSFFDSKDIDQMLNLFFENRDPYCATINNVYRYSQKSISQRHYNQDKNIHSSVKNRYLINVLLRCTSSEDYFLYLPKYYRYIYELFKKSNDFQWLETNDNNTEKCVHTVFQNCSDILFYNSNNAPNYLLYKKKSAPGMIIAIHKTAKIENGMFFWENGVIIDMNCVIYENVFLGKNVTVGTGTIIEADSYIGKGCQFGLYCKIASSTFIGPNNIFCNDVIIENTFLNSNLETSSKEKEENSCNINVCNFFKKSKFQTYIGHNNIFVNGAKIKCRSIIMANNIFNRKFILYPYSLVSCNKNFFYNRKEKKMCVFLMQNGNCDNKESNLLHCDLNYPCRCINYQECCEFIMNPNNVQNNDKILEFFMLIDTVFVVKKGDKEISRDK